MDDQLRRRVTAVCIGDAEVDGISLCLAAFEELGLSPTQRCRIAVYLATRADAEARAEALAVAQAQQERTRRDPH